MLQGEKADGGVDQEQAEKDPRAAKDHQGKHQGLPRRPGHRAGGDGPDQHDHRLEQAGQHGGLHVLAQHLEKEGSGPDHDPVKLGLGKDAGEGVKAPGKALRQGRGRQNHREAQGQLGQGVAADAVEAVQQKHHAEKNVGGDEQVTQTAEEEGAPVGHGGAEMDGQKFNV